MTATVSWRALAHNLDTGHTENTVSSSSSVVVHLFTGRCVAMAPCLLTCSSRRNSAMESFFQYRTYRPNMYKNVACIRWGYGRVWGQGAEKNVRQLKAQCSWVPGYRSRGPGFDSRRYQIFWEVVSLERGPLSLVSTIEELLGRKSSGSGLETRDYDRRDLPRGLRDNLYRKSWY
jgi:hypothetical protein